MERKSKKSFLMVVALVGMFGLVGQAGAVDIDGDGVDDANDLCIDADANFPVDVNGCIDTDDDGVTDANDVCPDSDPGVTVDPNGCELDTDGDGVVDSNELCPGTPSGDPVDPNGCSTLDNDSDGVVNGYDNCRDDVNPGQENSDTDGFGDVCDNCPLINNNQDDTDEDGVGDDCDNCNGTPAGHTIDPNGCSDYDSDGVYGFEDNCPEVANAGQEDNDDGDGVGDECDICSRTDPQWHSTVTAEGCADRDRDGVSDYEDQCPRTVSQFVANEIGCRTKTFFRVKTSDVSTGAPRNVFIYGTGSPLDSGSMGGSYQGNFIGDFPAFPVPLHSANWLFFYVNDEIQGTVWFRAYDDGSVELWDEGLVAAANLANPSGPVIQGAFYDLDPCDYPTEPCQIVTSGMNVAQFDGIEITIWALPDTDHDGVVDIYDECPNTPLGTPVDPCGCPSDSDGDLVPDQDDLCDDPCTWVDLHGCPDADRDGAANTADDCPASPLGATVTIRGCSDADGDGVYVPYDKCEGTAGDASAAGCPDADGDGVADTDDLCPDPCTWVDENGCPDTDGDGVANTADLCPGDANLPVNDEGCPDSDGDGIKDADDICASTPVGRWVDVDGCPLGTDTDGDGVPDANDLCPDTNPAWLSGGRVLLDNGCAWKDIYVETDGPVWGSTSGYVRTLGESYESQWPPILRTFVFAAPGGTAPGGLVYGDMLAQNKGISFRVYTDGSSQIWGTDDIEYWQGLHDRPGGCPITGLRTIIVGDSFDAVHPTSRNRYTVESSAWLGEPERTDGFYVIAVEDIDSDYDRVRDAMDECPGLPTDPNLSLVDLVGCPIWPACDDPWRPSSAGDVTGDCYVDEDDVVLMALDWLKCTHPLVAGCIQLQPSPLDLVPDTLYMKHESQDPNAKIIVDGNIDTDEWFDSDPCWMDLTRWYIPGTDPCDIVSAKYALLWGGDTLDPCMLIYAAVIVDDRDHVLKPATNWNTSDRIEIYVQGDPNDPGKDGGDVWGSNSPNKWFDKAQQYSVGDKGFAGLEWGVFGNGTTIPGLGTVGNAGFKYKVKVKNTTELHYEIQAKAWVWYGGRYDGASEARRLEPGMQVGFDIIADSRYSSPPEPCYAEPVGGDPNWDDYHETYEAAFGMLSANLATQKYMYAKNFQRWELKNYDGTNVPPECGDWGYLLSDVFRDSDCEVALADFAVVSNEWMDCTDPCAPCGYDPF